MAGTEAMEIVDSPPAKNLKTDCGNTESPLTSQSTEASCSFENADDNIDLDLYSRQLNVLGRDAMLLMGQSDILISNLGGLGVEIAKNIILSGVRSVMLHDQSPCKMTDLSSQFYLREQDLGENRAEACLERLAELNTNVTTQAYTEPLTADFIKLFKVVVLTETIAEDHLWMSEVTHENGVALIIADTRGLFGEVFCDFGDDFIVVDNNGEAPCKAMIANISRDLDGVVTCVDSTYHGLEDGDYVTFSDVEGMTELNGCAPRRIDVLVSGSFRIGDCSSFTEYISGGIVTQVKIPKSMNFKCLRESLEEPEFVITDTAKSDRPKKIHNAFNTLQAFAKEFDRLPEPWNEADANEFAEMAKRNAGPNVEHDQHLYTTFAKISRGSLAPINSVIGGIVAQEVMKACSGKFTPIFQWMYFDALECLPTDYTDICEDDCKESGSRYDGQTAVFGKNFQKPLSDTNFFVIGAGAIGCELLKNFAMMGIGTSDNGRVTVTDMDIIDTSNLNRQFLFRPADIHSPKSFKAMEAVWLMNTSMNIVADENRVCADSEVIYDDAFFQRVDGVATALDNLESRQYVDRLCVLHQKVLLESGILGTKGNTQVVIPFLTESYNSSKDPPEKSVPLWILNCFPNSIEHTLQWARDRFDEVFQESLVDAVQYLNNPTFLKMTEQKPLDEQLPVFLSLKQVLEDQRPHTIKDCVLWACQYFQKQYYNEIRKLLFNYPADQLTSTGKKFWSGAKRCPVPLLFSSSNNLHLDFIIAAANLRAKVYGIKEVNGRQAIKLMCNMVTLKPYVPQVVLNLVTDEEFADVDDLDNATPDITQLRNSIPTIEDLSGLIISPQQFNKDDDCNYHVDFLVSASNLRASNYRIPIADRLKSKLLASKIIPAIATTSSVIAGLSCLELYKFKQGHKDLSLYKNGFVNLALPFFGFSQPIEAVRKPILNCYEWTLWDRFNIRDNFTLKEFCEFFLKKFQLTITSVRYENSVIYATWMPEAKVNQRMPMPMTKLVVTVAKKKIEYHVRSLVFEITGEYSHQPNQDVPLPFVRYHINLSTCFLKRP